MTIDNIYRWGLTAIVVIFGLISASTMIIFCISLTDDTLGQAITAIAGLGIVLAQYVFAAKIQQDDKKGKLDKTTLVVTVVIFAASILGTWSWVESEFNTNNQSSTQGSDRYREYSDLIAMKKNTASEHLAQAKVYRDRGGNYNGQAKNSTAAANKVQAEIKSLMTERDNLPAITTGNSSQNMATVLGEWRLLVWLVFALIIDLCPVIAILELRKLEAASEAVPLANKGSATTATVEGSSNKTATANTTWADQKQQAHIEVLGDIANQHKRFTAIVSALRNGDIKPGKNAIQKQFSLGTATVDRIFEQLITLKVIKRTQGKRTYELINELVKEPLSNEKTDHQTMARPA